MNVVLYLVFLPRGPYVDYPAASRSVIGILVAALYCLHWWWRPQWSARLVLAGGAFGWSLPWYLLVAWKYSLATFSDKRASVARAVRSAVRSTGRTTARNGTFALRAGVGCPRSPVSWARVSR